MKKYFWMIALALVACSAPSFAQTDAISNYFEQYVDDERFTVVYLSPKMFQILGKLDLDELEDKEAAEVMDVVSDLKSLRILTTDENTMGFYEEAQQKLDTKGYDVLMTVRSDDENVNFLVKDDGGNVIHELLLLVGGNEDFVMMSFVGDINLKKISKLAKTIDVDGMEHLDKLDEEESQN